MISVEFSPVSPTRPHPKGSFDASLDPRLKNAVSKMQGHATKADMFAKQRISVEPPKANNITAQLDRIAGQNVKLLPGLYPSLEKGESVFKQTLPKPKYLSPDEVRALPANLRQKAYDRLSLGELPKRSDLGDLS